MSQTNNISAFRGEAVTLQFTLVPTTDITGWTMTFTLKRDAQDPSALLSVSGVITSAAGGIFTVSLTGTQLTLDAGIYVYDVWRTNSGYETVLSDGTFTVKQPVRV